MKPPYVAIIISLIFLLLPTANSTVDALGYAGDIKWGTNLFSPHHLLYNAFGWLLHMLLPVDVLSMMKALNAVLAGLSVWVLGRILKERKLPQSQIIGWMLLAGGSFGVMRFASDNETYLIPLLLSLMASWAFLKNSNQQRWLLLTGTFAALAVLFHQLHVWWWLGLLVGVMRMKSLKVRLYYCLPALMIPLVYLWVLWGKIGEIPGVGEMLAFALHDFAREEVSVGLGLKSLVLTPVNLFRTFFQVHGSIFLFLKNMSWLWFFVTVSVFALGKGLFRKWPIRFYKKTADPFAQTHLLILILHLLFAMLSHGNAEFMVIIPFLLPLASGVFFSFHEKTVVWIAIACWTWNLSLAIVPGHFFSLYDDQTVAEKLDEFPEAHFLLADKHQVANRYFYSTGDTLYSRLHDPGDYKALCRQNLRLLSDIPERPVLMSRQAFLTVDYRDFFIKKNKVATLNGYAGSYGLWELGCSE
ncbi:MAG: hypothetical protein R3B47_06185 [Bacteroidia bacterium]